VWIARHPSGRLVSRRRIEPLKEGCVGTETIQVSSFIPAPPMKVYVAWLSSEEHSEFTGGKAEIDAKVGGAFTAWDGYITGTNRELLEGRRVVQAWRTDEFPKGAPDSVLTVYFDPEHEGTHLTLVHSEIPEGQGRSYHDGWLEHYFEPMKKYFGKPAKKPAAKQAAAKKKPAAMKPAKKKAKR
jgi:uncharacterized protein YndB with AHSA1/START domain